MRRKLTPEQREARLERRAQARRQEQERVQELRDWHEAGPARAEQRRKKAAEAVKAAIAKARRQKKKVPVAPSRGVDRVPERLKMGAAFTVETHLYGKRDPAQERPLVQPAEYAGSNYRERRAQGVRGKPRKLRRRELPGAEARRLERNRRSWIQ